MSLNTFTNQAIALAGVAQSAALVQQLATTGSADRAALQASISSILKINSQNVPDVFGGLAGLKLGLECLQHQMASIGEVDADQTRYAAALVFLERQLADDEPMQKTIRIGVEKAQAQAEYFDLLHENVLANLSDLYYNTMSRLEPRIMVNGDERYLSQSDIVNKIRACLLAGIRAAWLWRQCGGTRWKFLFYRKKLHQEATALLAKVSA